MVQSLAYGKPIPRCSFEMLHIIMSVIQVKVNVARNINLVPRKNFIVLRPIDNKLDVWVPFIKIQLKFATHVLKMRFFIHLKFDVSKKFVFCLFIIVRHLLIDVRENNAQRLQDRFD
jgi:hypothetical protein